MKKIMTLLFFLSAINLFSQEAVITEIAGTVEIKHAGSDIWQTAQRGQRLSEDTLISTGFRSTALIQAGSTIITVRPLTRLGISELRSITEAETLNISLQAGRVRVDVNPPAGTRASTTIVSPVAVASVRGTSFEFDVINLIVLEGTVELVGNARGDLVLLDSGRHSFYNEQSRQLALPEAHAEIRPAFPIGTGAIPFMQQTSPAGNTEELMIGAMF